MNINLGCVDRAAFVENNHKCQDVIQNDQCNNEMTAAEAWFQCAHTCGCGESTIMELL